MTGINARALCAWVFLFAALSLGLNVYSWFRASGVEGIVIVDGIVLDRG